MFKDIIETIGKEIQNERNQEQLYIIFEPLIYKFKTSFYIIIFILILVLTNLFYSNMLLTEIIKKHN